MLEPIKKEGGSRGVDYTIQTDKRREEGEGGMRWHGTGMGSVRSCRAPILTGGQVALTGLPHGQR